VFLDLFVGSTLEAGTKIDHFVPDFLCVFIIHRISHGSGNLRDDLPVRLYIALRLNKLSHSLEASVRAGIDTFVLSPGSRRKYHVRIKTCLVHIDILHYHKVALIQSFSDFRKIRIRLCRILAEYVVRMDTFLFVFLMKDPVGHMSNGTSDLTWKG